MGYVRYILGRAHLKSSLVKQKWMGDRGTREINEELGADRQSDGQTTLLGMLDDHG